jgi:hypothetical protein
MLSSTAQKVGVGLAVLAAIGSIGPWIGGIVEVSGLRGDGWISLIAAAVALAAFLAQKGRRIWPGLVAFLAGLAASITAIYDLGNIEQARAKNEFVGALAHPGWGLYMTVVGGAGIVIVALVAIFSRQKVREPLAELDIPSPA